MAQQKAAGTGILSGRALSLIQAWRKELSKGRYLDGMLMFVFLPDVFAVSSLVGSAWITNFPLTISRKKAPDSPRSEYAYASGLHRFETLHGGW